jgi:cell pole-organizing protein PopZ
MEDILASIRRILNEDEPAGSAEPPPSADADEPLDLTREMLVSGPPPPPVAATPLPPARPPVEHTGQEPPPAPAPSPPAPPPVEALLAPAVAAAASASVGNLLRAVAAERGSAVARSGGPTIEDVVREELRPLLKDWLDQHLPAVVERLVRAEIERVVGRALS